MTRIGQRRIPEVMQGGGFGGQSYLLRDEFSDDRAAGAFLGTPAVPGPGDRTGVDINSIMSTSGGVMVVNGTCGPGDRLHYGGIARVPGRVFKVTFPSVTTVPQNIKIGLSVGSAAQVDGVPGFAYNSTTSVRIVDGSTQIYTTGSIGVAPHQFAFSLRANGGLSFINVAGKWLLFYIHPSDATATIVPKLIHSGGVAVNYTLDNWRVPQSLYISSLWYDSFTRANGALGSSESVGPDGQATPVMAWINQEGTIEIVGNAAQATALVGGIANATLATTYADAHIRASLTRAAGNIGINARYQDSGNHLRAYHDGTNVVCQQVIAGVPTTLRTGAAAFVSGAYVYLIVRGTTGFLFYNNAAIGASFTVPASTYTNHGVHTTDLGNTVQAIEMWPDGGGGEHQRLGTM